jgi:hypothetical protein
MGYYLLDHRNPHGDHFYTSRRGSIKAFVVHITAGLENQNTTLPDHSAEGTANYAATTDREVSWHSGSDADSSLDLLPYNYTAFQVVGYNSSTAGHEISKRDDSWTDEPAVWVERTLRNAAKHLAPKAKEYKVPLRHATRAELDRAIANNSAPVGFVSHASLDPDRRTDPGPDFPWNRFLGYIKEAQLGTTPEEEDMAEITNISKVAQNQISQAVQFGMLLTVGHTADAQTSEFASKFKKLVKDAVADALKEAVPPTA